MAQTASAGWYPDTTMPGTQRYWDGMAWTEHVAPLATAAPAEPDNSNVMGWGVLAAILLPIVGFVIGLTQINKGNDGLVIIGLSIASFFGWYYAFNA